MNIFSGFRFNDLSKFNSKAQIATSNHSNVIDEMFPEQVYMMDLDEVRI